MPKQSGKVRKRTRDPNEMARTSVDRVLELGETDDGKDPAAVALGRRGGLKGGPARMRSLTPEQRKALAQQAAQARWGTKPNNSG